MKWMGRYEGYNFTAFKKDVVAGSVVGIIAIPLGMAFAIASGVRPEYGLYTTIIAGILISLCGGSRFQIGGPTGAFIPVLFAVVMHYGYENLLIAGMLAGLMLIVMSLLKLGMLVRYIPKPVIIGFTTGIAVLIFSGQIGNFLGLEGVERHEYFAHNMHELWLRIDSVNGYSVVVALLSLTVLLVLPRLLPRVPASIAALIVSTAATTLFFRGEVATIGSVFGTIPGTLPHVQLPELSWERIVPMLQPAFVIALLGAIESLLSAVVADGMSGKRHDSNRELLGQGIANLAAPLFGGIPATGAIARTAANIRNGAVSPVSGMVHGVAVLLVLLLFAPYASSIPLAGMAPILMLVAWNMSERKAFMHVLKTKTGDSLVLVVTFLLTVFVDLPTAVEMGLLLALLLFVKRIGGMLSVKKMLPEPISGRVRAHRVESRRDCPQVQILTIEGPLFFGTSHLFEQRMAELRLAGIVLLRMGGVPLMDVTGEANLAELADAVKQSGGALLVSGIRSQPLEMLKQTGLYGRIGKAQFYNRTGEAIDDALQRLDVAKCLGCKQFAFRECEALCGAQASNKIHIQQKECSQ
ncbi:STAS domain-containing protein [Paenibacillus sp. IB182496]|uniref:STAS domain-containing protein n=1 Tax=Paenibacillus sabuli TaxID=2772509 RepID=A0A927BW28_9BACL|nr:SulP family inorganic anion transporter [Paenibacillus sabuli]MBD2847387.1 STAS domain-containing protein [Paenibacillus sabuli]